MNAKKEPVDSGRAEFNEAMARQEAGFWARLMNWRPRNTPSAEAGRQEVIADIERGAAKLREMDRGR
ncbi:glycerate dehydrogenase [Burkholderiales bacterium GJ-E10]|nr:glycerate dehydrogenase [Burkholderiales bacterium GJ-E10]